jgi:uncharacterized protein YdeI (YjbR/CyaY-like superfamily)
MAERAGAAFFESAADFRRWLEANHDKASELWVGYHKKGSGRHGMTYREAVDEALCFGWIDGLQHSLDETSYANRYTPRRRASNWSATNARRVQELLAEGRMHPAGIAAFERRPNTQPATYGYENRPTELPAELASVLRRQPAAWDFYARQPASYRRAVNAWIISAKRAETREGRLAALIRESADGRRVNLLRPPRVNR